MFKITLQNVGPDQVTKDIVVDVATHQTAQEHAEGIIAGVLQGRCFKVRANADGEYDIVNNPAILGNFTIVRQ